LDALQRAIQNLRLAQDLIDAGYKGPAIELHPDKGGTAEQMVMLHRARERLRNAAASLSWGPAFEADVARAEKRRVRAKGTLRSPEGMVQIDEYRTTVTKLDGFYVIDGDTVLAGPFDTNGAAWAWSDDHSAPDRAMTDNVSDKTGETIMVQADDRIAFLAIVGVKRFALR
jgi:hypothetical protein